MTGAGTTWWRRLLRRGRVPAALDGTRRDLVVVVSGFDDAEACSTTLARGAEEEPYWRPAESAVLRHHLTLPAGRVDEAASIAAQDGYVLVSPAGETVNPAGEASGTVEVLFQRVQVLDALHCSQERSRMAGLAQRLGGEATGWDATQPPRDSATSSH